MAEHLLNDFDFDDLPDDPGQRFLQLEERAREVMNLTINNMRLDDEALDELKTQYMIEVHTVATECGVDGLIDPFELDYPSSAFEQFRRQLSAVRTRSHLRRNSNSLNNGNVFSLGPHTKLQIRREVVRLREMIEASDLPPKQVADLLGRLKAIENELDRTRFNLGNALATLAIVSTVIGSSTAFFADAPTAVANIIKLIGQELEASEAERQLLLPNKARKASEGDDHR